MAVNASMLVKSTMRYGLYLGCTLVACALLFYLGFNVENLGLMQYSGLSILFGFVPMVVGLYLFMKRFRDKENGGTLTYVEGLRFGTQLMFFAGILTATYSLVFNTMIAPGHEAHVQEVIIEKTAVYLQQSQVPDADIEKQMNLLTTAVDEAKKASPLSVALWAIPQSAVYGLVISLIVAAILKRKSKDAFAQAMNEIKE